MGQSKHLHLSYSASEQRHTDALLLLLQARAGRRSSEPHTGTNGATPKRQGPTGDNADDFSRSIVEASVDCIEVLTLQGNVQSMNENGRCLLEIDDFQDVKGRPWIEFWSHEQRPAVEHAIEVARSGGVGRLTGHTSTAKGTPKWWDVVVSPMRDGSGTPTHLLAVSRDVTTARHHAEAGDLLNIELGHRIKNLFALVNGLITLAARPDPAVQPFAAILRDRFTALSRALNYVLPAEAVEQPQPATTLHGLLRVLLDPYEDFAQHQRRFVILGDDPAVGPKAVTSLALSVHELATNAVKYGALSNPDGRVSITCRCNTEGECELSWAERGGPLVSGQPERTGFGSKLVTRSITGSLGGQVRKHWGQEGLTLRMTLPLTLLSQ